MARALTRAVGLGDELVTKEGRVNRGIGTTLCGDEVAGLEALHKIGDEIDSDNCDKDHPCSGLKGDQAPRYAEEAVQKMLKRTGGQGPSQALVGRSNGPPTSGAPEIARGLPD